MSNKQGSVRTFHPAPVAEVGERVVIEMLAVARDLRSGVIPREKFDMRTYGGVSPNCGTPCCIVGHLALRLKCRSWDIVKSPEQRSMPLYRLCSGFNPSIPSRAADAIERYVYDYAEYPWSNNSAALAHYGRAHLS